METPSRDQRLEAVAPLAVAHRATEERVEHRARRFTFLVRHETDARNQEVAQQLGIEPRDGERALEGPDRALGIRRRAARAHRLEEPFGLDVLPSHPREYRGALGLCLAPVESGTTNPTVLSTPEEVTRMNDVWTFRDTTQLGSNVVDTKVDLSGYKVEALDGSIGSIDESTYGTSRSYVVVDTGPWIFGKKVMLPAGVIRGIDEDEERVYVNRTKDEIKNAPEFDDAMVTDETYHSSVGAYYGQGGQGYRGWDDTP